AGGRGADGAAGGAGRGFRRAARLVHGVPGALERADQNLPQCGFVVDDEYLHGSLLLDRQAHGKESALPGLGFDRDVAAGLAQQAAAQGEADAAALALWLGGEELVESAAADALVHAGAVVRNGEQDRVAIALRRDADSARDS